MYENPEAIAYGAVIIEHMSATLFIGAALWGIKDSFNKSDDAPDFYAYIKNEFGMEKDEVDRMLAGAETYALINKLDTPIETIKKLRSDKGGRHVD